MILAILAKPSYTSTSRAIIGAISKLFLINLKVPFYSVPFGTRVGNRNVM